jgi:hypothetical protein
MMAVILSFALITGCAQTMSTSPFPQTGVVTFSPMPTALTREVSIPISNNNTHFSELLKLLPASAKETKGFDLFDHEAWLKVNGLSFYDTTGQKVTPKDFVQQLISLEKSNQLVGGGIVSVNSHYSGWDRFMLQTTITDEYMGYDYADIGAEINNIAFGGERESATFWNAFMGNFNSQVTQQAFNLHKDWNPKLIETYTNETYKGFTIHSWGSNVQDLDYSLQPPHIGFGGYVMPLAISDKNLLLSDTVSNIKTMIDASQGITPSLADVPEYSLLAQGLDKLGAVCAELADESLAPYDEQYFKSYTHRLKKFLTAGTGAGKDEKGFYVATVIVHDSPETATQNASLLRQVINTRVDTIYGKPGVVWKDIITDTDIKADGKVLLAKLYTTRNIWVISGNTLLVHDQ